MGKEIQSVFIPFIPKIPFQDNYPCKRKRFRRNRKRLSAFYIHITEVRCYFTESAEITGGVSVAELSGILFHSFIRVAFSASSC